MSSARPCDVVEIEDGAAEIEAVANGRGLVEASEVEDEGVKCETSFARRDCAVDMSVMKFKKEREFR